MNGLCHVAHVMHAARNAHRQAPPFLSDLVRQAPGSVPQDPPRLHTLHLLGLAAAQALPHLPADKCLLFSDQA